MARRRMIDPFFRSDPTMGSLPLVERFFILSCVSQADDEGRLEGHPASLKAEIFRYDDDLDKNAVKELRDSCLAKMKDWPPTHPYLIALYSNSHQEFLCFPNWGATNKPSHPTKSQLPAPPLELLPIFSRTSPEELANPPAQAEASLSRTSPEGLAPPPGTGQVRSVKSSLSKVNVGDFTKIVDETEMTDTLIGLLLSAAAGPGPRLREAAILKEFWRQLIGEEMNSIIYQFTITATQDYPPAVLARAYAKAVKYKGGKTGSYKYIDVILKEEMAKSHK